MEPQFKPGDRVRIRVDYPARHFRTPGYIQGKTAPSRPCMALFAIRKRSPMVVTVCPNNSSISCALSRPTSGGHTPQRQTSSTSTFMSPG